MNTEEEIKEQEVTKTLPNDLEVLKQYTPSHASVENIELWKKLHSSVKCIMVMDDDHVVYEGYFHRPNLDLIRAVTAQSKKSEVDAAQTLFNGCWLGGDEAIKNDSVLFLAAVGELDKLMLVRATNIKNL